MVDIFSTFRSSIGLGCVRSKTLVAFIALIFLFTGRASSQGLEAPPPKPAAGPTASEIAQSGERNGSVYRNRLLRFSLSTPEHWNLASEEMNKALLAEGNEKIKANETKSRQQAFDRSVANTSVLFALAKFPFTDSGNSATLACGFERTAPGQTIQTYAQSSKELVLNKLTSGKLTKDVYSLRIDGTEFVAFDIEAIENGIKVSQSYYVSARGGGILFFVLTWVDGGEDIKRTLEKVVRSAKFDS